MAKNQKNAATSSQQAKLKMQMAILKQLLKGKWGLKFLIIFALYSLITGAVMNVQLVIHLIQKAF